jgi:hypothetical protein
LINEEKINYSKNQTSKNNYLLIAGLLLIIAGLLSIILWVPMMTISTETLEMYIDISQFRSYDPTITIENVKQILTTCATIAIVISVFPILGGILTLKKKIWGVTLVCGLVGLLTFIPFVLPGILSLVSTVLIYKYKKEFKK